MIDIPRRRLIQTAAASSALSMAGGAFADDGRPATLKDIDHIIILMKENRSFDHYFGALRGVRGFDDRTAVRKDASSIFRQADGFNPTATSCRSD